MSIRLDALSIQTLLMAMLCISGAGKSVICHRDGAAGCIKSPELAIPHPHPRPVIPHSAVARSRLLRRRPSGQISMF